MFKKVITVLAVVFAVVAVLQLPDRQDGITGLTVAACPSYHHLLEELDVIGIRTGSTKESIELVEKGEAQAFISGRALKPEEPGYEYKVIGEGFSLLYSEPLTFTEHEIKEKDIYFFTDQEVGEVKEKLSFIDEVEKVENVYEKISEGVVVTDIENTDYEKAEMVTVYQEDGSRSEYSRTPVLYTKK